MEKTERFVIDISPEEVFVTDLLTDRAVRAFPGRDRLIRATETMERLNQLHELGIADPADWMLRQGGPGMISSDPHAFLAETLPTFAGRQHLDVALLAVEVAADEMIRSATALKARVAKIRETLDRPTPEAEKSVSVPHSGPDDVLCGNRRPFSGSLCGMPRWHSGSCWQQ